MLYMSKIIIIMSKKHNSRIGKDLKPLFTNTQVEKDLLGHQNLLPMDIYSAMLGICTFES